MGKMVDFTNLTLELKDNIFVLHLNSLLLSLWIDKFSKYVVLTSIDDFEGHLIVSGYVTFHPRDIWPVTQKPINIKQNISHLYFEFKQAKMFIHQSEYTSSWMCGLFLPPNQHNALKILDNYARDCVEKQEYEYRSLFGKGGALVLKVDHCSLRPGEYDGALKIGAPKIYRQVAILPREMFEISASSI